MELNLTYLDIEKMLRSYADGLEDMSEWVDGLIEDHSIILSSTIKAQGLDPSEVSWVPPVYVIEGDPDSGVVTPGYSKHPTLFVHCQQIVKLRVRAEVMMALSHELGTLSKQDRDRADRMEDVIHQRPETLIEGWSGKTMRGSWGYDTDANMVMVGGGQYVAPKRIFNQGGLRRHRL